MTSSSPGLAVTVSAAGICAQQGPVRTLPIVVQFVGYGGGRGLPANHTLFPSVGYAAFVMDTRGQSGRWTVGATGDLAPLRSTPS